ncbi:MAG: maleylpyruvate isomerase family mycothiol-dependent enzyme [Acidimicrobiales bacterium]
MIVRARQTGQMDPHAHRDGLEAAGRRLLDVAASTADAVVPSCDGWLVRDLVGHVGTVCPRSRRWSRSGAMEPLRWSSLEPVPDDDDARLAYASSGLDRLLVALATADPTRPVWTWSPDRATGFYFRRAHFETLVHRVDAELAVGDQTPLDSAASFDGVDELYGTVLAAREAPLPTGSLHLHQTDGDGG